MSKPVPKWATLAGAFRAGALISLAAAVWAIYMIEATPDMGGLVFMMFWTPLFLGTALVLFVTSALVGRDPAPSKGAAPAPTYRRLNRWVNVVVGIGIVALLGEAVVIFGEGKRIQAVELFALSAAIAGFRWWVGRLRPERQRIINLLTIPGLLALGLAWWWLLDLILVVFDRS